MTRDLHPSDLEPVSLWTLYPDANPQRPTRPAPPLVPLRWRDDRLPIARGRKRHIYVADLVLAALPGTVSELCVRTGRPKNSVRTALFYLRTEGKLKPGIRPGRLTRYERAGA